jgi:hypothetical protein
MIVESEAARAQACAEQVDRRVRDAQARAQALGYVIHVTGDGFLLCRWGRTRLLPDLDAVDGALEQIGGRDA